MRARDRHICSYEPLSVVVSSARVCGVPNCEVSADQFGNGFMQFFAQDTVASVKASRETAPTIPGNFLNFSVDPNRTDKNGHHLLPALDNFVFYYTLGNVGFVGFSGAYPLGDTLPHLREACAHFAQSQPALIYVVGHWDRSNASGCQVEWGRCWLE